MDTKSFIACTEGIYGIMNSNLGELAIAASDKGSYLNTMLYVELLSKLALVWLAVCCATSTAVAADSLYVANSELRIQWRGQFNDKERLKMRRWLEHAANSAAQLYGRLPRNPIRIVLQRSNRSGEPVPFGHVLRNKPQGLRFWVNPEMPLQDFIDDWTAVHEFVHLFIPYPGDRDIWLSEGLATYYQNLLQARAGVINEQRAWQKLYEGFVRGQKDNRYPHLRLDQISPRMRETRSFMRVYWAGTAYFLEADLLLRQQSNNQQSLDTVLRDFVDCCLRDGYFSGWQLVQKFDQLSNSKVFSPLYNTYRSTYAQPDPLPLLAQLGVRVRSRQVVLDKGESPHNDIRRSMTRRP